MSGRIGRGSGLRDCWRAQKSLFFLPREADRRQQRSDGTDAGRSRYGSTYRARRAQELRKTRLPATELTRWSNRSGGLPNHELRADLQHLRPCPETPFADLGCQGLRRQQSHLEQRLANGGQRGVLEGGRLHVIEANHGHIFGNAQLPFAKGPDGADRGDIVEGKKSRKGLATGEEALGGLIPRFMVRLRALKLGYQGGVDGEIQPGGRSADRLPADRGV